METSRNTAPSQLSRVRLLKLLRPSSFGHGIAVRRPPGPSPSKLPASPGPRGRALPPLSLRLRRCGRPRVGLRLPYPPDDVLLAGGSRGRSSRRPAGSIPEGDPEFPGGDGGQAPLLRRLTGVDRHRGSCSLPRLFLRRAGQAAPRPLRPRSGRGAGNLVCSLSGGWGACDDGGRPGPRLQGVVGGLLSPRGTPPAHSGSTLLRPSRLAQPAGSPRPAVGFLAGARLL